MENSRVHDELRAFPKNHKLSEESVEKISITIERELNINQEKFSWKSYSSKKLLWSVLISISLATVFFSGLIGREAHMQEHAVRQFDIEQIYERENMRLQVERSNREIYGSFGNWEYSWDTDPREPENLFHEEGSVVHLKVLSIDEAVILPKSERFYTDMPFTPLEVEIVETISGNPLSGVKTIYMDGGDIRISKLVESWNENRVSNMGLNKLSKEEQETKFMSFTSEYDYDMDLGKEYAVILTRQETEEDIYTVTANGYGIFEMEATEQGEEIYRNTITNKTSTLKFSKNE
ncbi:hypothetical protein [Bacillus sp. 2205SS5-2]|uniref:hypothetical protein n=1 Tax=Bacillus sp. 2205SS5-2 TaxID=3109031 RepID=UPI003005C02E